MAETVPASILLDPGNRPALSLGEAATEAGALAELQALASQNQVWRSYLGAGYHNTFTPEPIRRNVLETPAGTRPTRPIRPRSRRAGWKR